MNISFSILEILESWLIIIRVDIDYEENVTIVKKEKTTNVPVIKKVFSQRELHVRKSHVNVWDNS